MRIFTLFVLLLVCGSVAAAQEITGTITGVVKDESGGIVPGATVTVRNVATNVDTIAVTDVSGVYVATALPVGDYEVKVELAGFRTYIRRDLELHVADRLRVDPVLRAGTVSETVTVTGASPVVQTETSDVSTLINGTQVSQMP